jgi:hypothetical protein
MRLRELTKQARDDLGSHALERSDAQTSRVAGLEGSHVRLRSQEPRLDRVGVPEEHLTGLGEGDRARAAGAVDEAQPDDALEGGDLLGNGRLRVARRSAARPNEPSSATPERDQVAETSSSQRSASMIGRYQAAGRCLGGASERHAHP